MTLYGCVLFFSFMNNIDPLLTQAVIKVESNNNPFALSANKYDYGLMQIRKKYVPESRLQLFNPCTNIKRGTALLRAAREKCTHKLDNTFLVCYNVGITGARRIRFPKKFPYYVKVTKEMI